MRKEFPKSHSRGALGEGLKTVEWPICIKEKVKHRICKTTTGKKIVTRAFSNKRNRKNPRSEVTRKLRSGTYRGAYSRVNQKLK